MSTTKVNILKMVKNQIFKNQISKQNEFNIKKQQIIYQLSKKWSDEEVHDYNCDLIITSAGWFGGDYNEIDIKRNILNDHANYFSEDEYLELENKYCIKPKIREL